MKKRAKGGKNQILQEIIQLKDALGTCRREQCRMLHKGNGRWLGMVFRNKSAKQKFSPACWLLTLKSRTTFKIKYVRGYELTQHKVGACHVISWTNSIHTKMFSSKIHKWVMITIIKMSFLSARASSSHYGDEIRILFMNHKHSSYNFSLFR